jgi:hypothetical protein
MTALVLVSKYKINCLDRFIQMQRNIATSTNQPRTNPMKLWYRQSYRLHNGVGPRFPKDTLRPSRDIIQAICQHLQSFSTHSLLHVKGHRDHVRQPGKSPLRPSQNKLATALRLKTTWHPDPGINRPRLVA